MGQFRLPRLTRDQAVVDKEGRAQIIFQRWWQSVVEKIETAINGLDVALDALADAVAAIQSAQEAADAANAAAENAQAAASSAQAAAEGANTAAESAQGSADAANVQAGLLASFPEGVTLDASDTGSDAQIVINAHTRTYGDGTSVAVSGGVIAALAYSTKYYVFYDDPDQAGGSVSYFASSNEADAAQTNGRHTVGSVTTPAAAGSPNSGAGVRPPGVGAIP